jgi:hypothetical protein
MPIAAVCTCGKKYQVDDSLAGKRVKCKACGGGFTIPQPAAVAAADDNEFRLAPLETTPSAVAPMPLQAMAAPAAVVAKSGAAPAAKAPAKSATQPPSPQQTSGLPFFLAVSQGWSKSMVYRVYIDRDALLLLDVCPFNVMVDLELARRADGTNWMVKTVQALKGWVVSIGGMILAIIAMVGVGVARFGGDKPNEGLQIVSLLLMLAAIVFPVILLLGTWSMRVLIRRSQQLDGFFPDEIRQEADEGGDKYRLRPGELSDVRIFPAKDTGVASRQKAEATFKHPSGSWRLLIFARQDVQLACSTFRRFCGGAAQIDPSLERI